MANGCPIGIADYRDIDPFAGRATVGIVIGERNRWGGGYGSEALRLLLGHLFGACRLRRVELDTWSGNERAIRAFRRAGLVEEGRRRASVRVGGEWYDSVMFGCSARSGRRVVTRHSPWSAASHTSAVTA
ncbi:GNAT family N-acetyltransferase [Streptomyces sp. NPDC057543]|uniref:GNAT family N-acetyltransferase n=1 Tax=Streptomyces sp. NPDC057543 TaxID=3346163 RepID=UPI003681D60D